MITKDDFFQGHTLHSVISKSTVYWSALYWAFTVLGDLKKKYSAYILTFHAHVWKIAMCNAASALPSQAWKDKMYALWFKKMSVQYSL